jgi:hypothetical protein
VPTVLVVVEGQGSGDARVLLEGAPLPREAVGGKQPLDPGTYGFEARVGDRHVRKVITLKRGEHLRVVLALPDVPRDEPGPTIPPKREDTGRSVRIVGYTAVGLGGAALSLGSIAGLLVLMREQDLLERCPDRQCPPSEHDDARTFDTLRFLTTGGLIAGGVLAAAGITMVLLAPNAEVSAWIAPWGAGVGGRF